jgi:hypothetical protein
MLDADFGQTDMELRMDMERPPRRKRLPRSLLLAIATTMLLALGVASAGAASNIEGIWSFNGGQIGIQRQSNGTYTGIVVIETRFAECTHPVGQEIWTGITEQPDGSYWGLHQWYLGGPACTENPVRGPTAWRVLEGMNGSHYLRVCFSHPGTSQPEIAANGAPLGESEYAKYHVTYGCYSSSLTASLPVAPGEKTPLGETPTGTPGTTGSGTGTAGSGVAGSIESLTLPSPKKCLSARLFKIHLANPKYDPFKTVTVTLKGRKIATARQGKFVVATINLESLPEGTFTIKIRATTVLKHHLSSSRTYHTCVKKITPKKRGTKG